jgi:hypothetical protein
VSLIKKMKLEPYHDSGSNGKRAAAMFDNIE